MRKRLLIMAFAILSVFTISAQETTSDIAGRVTGNNNPLPGATVNGRACSFGINLQNNFTVRWQV